MTERSDLRVSLTFNPSAHDDEVLRKGLIEANKPYFGGGEAKHISAYLKDENDNIKGGVIGLMQERSCHIEVLWVHEILRKKGYGRVLMERVEEMAGKEGCVSILVETFDFQAKEFYEKCGYNCAGVIKKWLHGQDFFLFKKDITPACR